jgi:hypothetical protein
VLANLVGETSLSPQAELMTQCNLEGHEFRRTFSVEVRSDPSVFLLSSWFVKAGTIDRLVSNQSYEESFSLVAAVSEKNQWFVYANQVSGRAKISLRIRDS